MVDANGAPRRVSMAYLLGFSNKPFKDGGPAAPPPRQPSAFKQMVTTPGGVIEWTASDGRRGRLTGPAKPRLTANNLVQVPGDKAPSVKAVDEDDGGIFGGGLFNDAHDAPAAKAASTKAAEDGQAASSDWVTEQDDKLMELKGESKSWADIATAIDKKEHECRERFKQIRPKDWKPNNAKGGGGGKQPKDKQKKNRGEKQQDGDKKDEGKNDGVADGSFDANAWPGGGDSGGNNNSWGNSNDNGGATGNDTSWNNDSNKDANWGGDGAWDTTNSKSEKKDGAGDQWGSGGWGNADNTDGNKKGDDAGHQWGSGGWDNADNTDGNKKTDDGSNKNEKGWGGDCGDNAATGGWCNDGWGPVVNDATKNSDSKKGSSNKGSSSEKGSTSNKINKRCSEKAPSQAGSKSRSSQRIENTSTSSPKEYELKPDSTFSADDLRLIAKILQQDCSMVWNRVSWRFKDKTGRNLHPEVFEKKITGKVEERGGER